MKIKSKKNTGYFNSLLFALMMLASQLVMSAPFDTPNYFKCDNRIGGEWNFGRVPNACDVDPWGDPTYVKDKFTVVMFNDNVGRTAERNRYMLELHAMLRDSVSYYLTSRKPTASQAEIDAWQRANFAKAHQETFWTHYRDATDSRTKMIRGDFGHGHGLVQIDDRWHFTKIEEGKGWHIFENIIYGMELFYDAWQDAASASCVSSSTAWRSRSRSAYAVYNGGASKICRWTNPNDVWARNDNGFRDKYDSKTWENYISDFDYQTTIDVPCFMEGNEGCTAIEPVDANDVANWPDRQINLHSGEACIYSAGALQCVENSSDIMCLNIQFGSTSGSLSPAAETSDAYIVTTHEKHQCFADAVEGLSTVGQSISSLIGITMRATPGGTSLDQSSIAGKVYQVLDYSVSNENDQFRYYLVSENGQQGYIYAGSQTNYSDWTSSASHSELITSDIIIAQMNDPIRIIPETGINLRDQPSGVLLATVPQNEELVVEDVIVQGADNFIYYKASFAGTTGYIYAGKVLNGNTLADWTSYVLPTVPGPANPIVDDVIEVVSAGGINLRATPGGAFVTGVPENTLLYVFETVIQGTNDYLYYKVTYNGNTGYIYGGQTAGDSTVDNWALKSTVQLAKVDNHLTIVATNGINMRTTPGGTFLQTVPNGVTSLVVSSAVQGSNNYVYYEITYNGQTGFVYSGYLSPSSTISLWTTF